jgi:hypothetical protein
MIQIHVDTRAFERGMTELVKEQLPFAASRALNITTKEAQSGIQSRMRSNFTIRRDWVTQQIKIKHFSDKHDDPMYTTIEVDPKADFLDKFEEGGVKTPRSSANLAVPIGARPNKSAIVPPQLRIKNLHLHAVGKAIRGDQRTFLMRAGGRQGIFQRTGPGKRDYILLYWLTPSVPIPRSLHFVETVMRIVEDRWARNLEQFLTEALATAK